MPSPATRTSLPAVTAAGVVAILFGLFGALGSMLAGVSALILPQLPSSPAAPPMPAGIQALSSAFMFFMFAICIFGIFVGVGVIRRKNWARISILVWAGFMTLVSLGAMVFGLLIFSAMPVQVPNARSGDVTNIILFVKVFFVIFYGIPTAVGIWWLVLFTRKRVSDAFTNPVEAVPVLDASGFPQNSGAAAPPLPKPPSCPLPLAILAGWFIFSGVCSALVAIIPMPATVPLYLFGHVYFGVAPKIFLGLIGIVIGVSGVGMLKLQPWALHTALAVQGIFFVNGLFALISPTFQLDMQEAMEKMMGSYPAFPGGSNPFLSPAYFRSIMVFSLVFAVIIIAVLAFQRSRFLEQAEAAAAKA